MTNETKPGALTVSDEDLNRYVDGALDGARQAQVAAQVAADPALAAEVRRITRQDEAIRGLFGAVANAPVPLRLRPRAAGGSGPPWGVRAAAAVVLLAVGLGGGYWLRGGPVESPGEDLMAFALAAHSLYSAESRHAVEVGEAETAHLSTWLSNRLARPISPPDLTAYAFSFLGGRLLPGYEEAGPAAQLMYQRPSGERLTLYITASPATEAPATREARSDGLSALYWSNAAITCTLVGALDAATLHQIGQAVFAALAHPPGAA